MFEYLHVFKDRLEGVLPTDPLPDTGVITSVALPFDRLVSMPVPSPRQGGR